MVGPNLPGGSSAAADRDSCNDNYLEGLSQSELTMIQRLAGNDAQVRKKTMKKLKKWLNALSLRVPDSPESRAVVEPNFVRVWKALFYCMWMADKPLPQEQLAEQISDLLSLFSPKPCLMMLFVEWFIRTVAREWAWIDRFRMDKFMMLIRRFIRKTFEELSALKWKGDSVDGFLKLLVHYVFNRHPSLTPKKIKSKLPIPATPTKAPLGFQIHVVDIFLEELAKTGGDNLKNQKVMKMISPFVQELALNDDDRLLDEIKERIFHHLMRQSDVGIDYQESKYSNFDNMNEDGESDSEEDCEDDRVSDGPLDPRAGAVDVILPQLQIHYDYISQKLVEAGGQKTVKLKNRKLLYNLARQFKELTTGQYPLAIPEDNTRIPAIPKKELKNATIRLLAFQESTQTSKRKTKKERKRQAIQALNNVSVGSNGSEDGSMYLQDDDILEHVDDNFMSYIEDEIQRKHTALIVEAKPPKTKKRKAELEISKGGKRKHSDSPQSENGDAQSSCIDSDVYVSLKSPSSKNLKLSTGSPSPTNSVKAFVTPSESPKNRRKLNGSVSSVKKRVSFVLAKNLEHEHSDYKDSIERSPAIPFDARKKPNFGLLRSPASGFSSPIISTFGTPRRKASELFF